MIGDLRRLRSFVLYLGTGAQNSGFQLGAQHQMPGLYLVLQVHRLGKRNPRSLPLHLLRLLHLQLQRFLQYQMLIPSASRAVRDQRQPETVDHEEHR